MQSFHCYMLHQGARIRGSPFRILRCKAPRRCCATRSHTGSLRVSCIARDRCTWLLRRTGHGTYPHNSPVCSDFRTRFRRRYYNLYIPARATCPCTSHPCHTLPDCRQYTYLGADQPRTCCMTCRRCNAERDRTHIAVQKGPRCQRYCTPTTTQLTTWRDMGTLGAKCCIWRQIHGGQLDLDPFYSDLCNACIIVTHNLHACESQRDIVGTTGIFSSAPPHIRDRTWHVHMVLVLRCSSIPCK